MVTSVFAESAGVMAHAVLSKPLACRGTPPCKGSLYSFGEVVWFQYFGPPILAHASTAWSLQLSLSVGTGQVVGVKVQSGRPCD